MLSNRFPPLSHLSFRPDNYYYFKIINTFTNKRGAKVGGEPLPVDVWSSNRGSIIIQYEELFVDFSATTTGTNNLDYTSMSFRITSYDHNYPY